MIINYKVKSVNYTDILVYLESCNKSFTPALESKVNLKNFSKKILNHAITFEAWEGELLLGMVSVYYNSYTKEGFINHVCILNKYREKGIAGKLLAMCFDDVEKQNISAIVLEVSIDNITAISLYKAHGFCEFKSYGDVMRMKKVLRIEDAKRL